MAALAERVRATDDARELERLVLLVLEQCDPGALPSAGSSGPIEGKPKEARFTAFVLLALPTCFAIALALTSLSAHVNALQSRIPCPPGVQLDWRNYESANGKSELRGCGGTSEGAQNPSALLLANHALAFPVVLLGFLLTRRGRG